MDLSAILAHLFLLLVAVFIIFSVLQRVLGRRANAKRKKRLRFAGAFIGNALMSLHAIIHPHTRHVIAEQLKEDQEEDPADPTYYLRHQLKRIRNGERLDHITTRMHE